MKVWLDVANSPHVAFLRPFIERIESEGGHVYLTARKLGNTLDLLDQSNLPYQRVDGHGRKGTFGKAVAFIRRCISLYRWVTDRSPDVAFAQSSFHLPIVARLAGVPSVYTNDNEHAKGNLIAGLFADRILFPEAMRPRLKARQMTSKVSFYPGVKEAIYLAPQEVREREGGDRCRIYFRPEPWTAQYHAPRLRESIEMVQALLEFGPLTVLPRDATQRRYFRDHCGHDPRLTIAQRVVQLEEIAREARVFIGAGGSMSREAAVLGVPTITVYSGSPLAVDDLLCDMGLLHRVQGVEALTQQIEVLFRRPPELDSTSVLADGQRAFEQLYASLQAVQK